MDEPRGILAAVVRGALRAPGVVTALAVALLAYGVYSIPSAKYDVFPEFAPPQVVVQTEAPGLAPEQVEQLVTRPLESELNGLPGIELMKSTSIQGLSVIFLTFDPGRDPILVRQGVAERIGAAAEHLPEGVEAPEMAPLTSSTNVVLILGMTSPTRSLMEVRAEADWTVRPRLLAVPGVAKLTIQGGEVRQVQVQADPARMVERRVTWDEVVEAARDAAARRGGGFVDTPNQRVVIRPEGPGTTAEEMARAVVARGEGGNVTLGDVARVVDAPEPLIGAASVDGVEGVQIMVGAQYGANTLDVAGDVERAVEELRPVLEREGIELTADVFRPAQFIQTALGNVAESLLIGGLLVVAVLVLFLRDPRTAAISCAAIPISLVSAVLVLRWTGHTLNTMTLGGLAIAIGEVVDDAVIDVENILRRLRENAGLPSPRPAWRVALDASLEIRGAVVFAAVAVILVFVPVLTLPGLAGRLFAPLAVAYVSAIVASLATALTVTPALCLLLIGRGGRIPAESGFLRALKAGYRSILERVERNAGVAVLGAAAVCLAALVALTLLGGGFLPELREGHLIVHMALAPGASLEESMRLGGRVTEAMRELPFVRRVSQRAGRAELADDVWGPYYTEFEVDLNEMSGDEAEEAVAQMRETVAGFPGANFAVRTFLTERVEETLSGYTATVVVTISGDDLDELDAVAQEAAAVMREVPGAADVGLVNPPGTPELGVRLRPVDLSRWGLASGDVLDAVRGAYGGTVVGQQIEGGRSFDVAVILAPERRATGAVGDLPVRTADGADVPLSAVADIYATTGRYSVDHRAGRRVQTVTCNVAGRDVASFAQEAERRVRAEVPISEGTFLEFGGAAEAQKKAARDLLVHSLLAGAAIVALLALGTRHPQNLALILLNLPMALAGGVLAAYAGGGWLSVGSLVGFVTLFGITLRNSIMMISHFEHLVAREGMTWGVEAALRGASERVAPILMTALVTANGLLPLALGSGEAGREVEGPMAIVILGGLATSTALNLLVLPALARRFGRFERVDEA